MGMIERMRLSLRSWAVLAGTAVVLAPSVAAYAGESKVDSGDTAWMLTSMALVLFMTIPGLALFYGGLVRSKNVLGVLMQCFAITCLISVLWVICGYSFAFSQTGMEAGKFSLHSLVGGLDKAFCMGITPESIYSTQTIPEPLFLCYQLTFAIITPALIIGAFAERMKFSAMLWFMGLWALLVYNPIAHMVWGGAGALLADMNVLDFAGGSVVHVNAGIAALVCALVLGKRTGYPTTQPMPPHSLTLTVVGASMLWVGWFGFNAGSAVAANGAAAMAMLVTHTAAATAALVWVGIEWVTFGKPSALGATTGAVAGLVAITPASGFVGPMGSIAIGAVVGVVCFLSATKMKHLFGYDDSLDAFGVHGVGGALGAILTGIFAAKGLGGYTPNDLGIGAQVWAQFVGVAITVVWSGIISYILLKVIDKMVGLRVTPTEEEEGLDVSQHGEKGYNV